MKLNSIKQTKTEGSEARPQLHYRTVIGRDKRIQTRAQIIECAINVFAEMGPDAPVIDDFMKRAGVSRSTFYNYFRTTHELLEATVDVVANNFVDSMDELIDDSPNPVMRLAIASRLYYRKALTDPCFAAFTTSIPNTASHAEKNLRRDLGLAIKRRLITVDSIELGVAVAAGTMSYAIRGLTKQGARPVQGEKVVRAILIGLGASSKLIEEALAIPLPNLNFSSAPSINSKN